MKYNNPLYLPKHGDIEINILNKRVLEIEYVYKRDTNTSQLEWNFVTNGVFTAPTTLSVSINGVNVPITNITFKRRPIYAPLKARDLRIGNWLYLTLNTDILEGQKVTVTDSSKTILKNDLIVTKSNTRLTPVIHVNQAGYNTGFTKKAFIGYFTGNTTELDLSYITSFKVLDTNNNIVYTGTTKARLDVGYAYSPTPYQKVLELDFSSLNTPGKYKIQIDDLGISYDFNIHNLSHLGFARSLAQGLLNQRCGYAVKKPFSRHEKNACHKTAEIPMPAANYPETWAMIASESSIKSPTDLYFPYNRTGSIDVTGSTHDAGDYSRYLQNIGSHVHYLTFGADCGLNFDNLGLPESNNGKNDILELMKWEADFLLKMQDTDGGFYILIYPKTRAYELDASLQGNNYGDSVVVWPKNTIATAAAVGALAEVGSSPTFRQVYGNALADSYLNAAKNGWTFLMNAITKYGLLASYQQIRGGDSDHTGALCYAAAALFVATGDIQYRDKLFTWLPNPNNTPWQWGWKIMHGYYGCALRVYAFAARNGRRNINELNATYLQACENQITIAGDNCVRDSNNCAYGAAVTFENKNYAGSTFAWYFLTEVVFDLIAAYKLTPKQSYIDAGVLTYSYLVGCNPINVSSISGLGLRRPRIFVSNYQLNDFRTMPPNGQIRASISAGATYLDKYVNPDNTNELNSTIYPDDTSLNNKYPPQDRYIDQFNVMDEETVSPVNIRGFIFACWLASL